MDAAEQFLCRFLAKDRNKTAVGNIRLCEETAFHDAITANEIIARSGRQQRSILVLLKTCLQRTG